MTDPQKFSVAIITHNEAEGIAACLDSVGFADEVVVVDSESNDATVAIAKRKGARVISQAWLGFGRQKQFAVDSCTNDWVLIVDADERIPPATADEIRSLLRQPEAQAYSFPRRNFFNGKAIQHGSWGSDRVVRLLHRKTCHLTDRAVHEQVVAPGIVGRATNPIEHYPRRNLAAFLEKANRYSTLGVQHGAAQASIFSALLHALWSFLFNYCFRLGVLDGPEGVVIAFGDMVDTFFKYAKTWERQQNEKSLHNP